MSIQPRHYNRNMIATSEKEVYRVNQIKRKKDITVIFLQVYSKDSIIFTVENFHITCLKIRGFLKCIFRAFVGKAHLIDQRKWVNDIIHKFQSPNVFPKDHVRAIKKADEELQDLFKVGPKRDKEAAQQIAIEKQIFRIFRAFDNLKFYQKIGRQTGFIQDEFKEIKDFHNKSVEKLLNAVSYPFRYLHLFKILKKEKREVLEKITLQLLQDKEKKLFFLLKRQRANFRDKMSALIKLCQYEQENMFFRSLSNRDLQILAVNKSEKAVFFFAKQELNKRKQNILKSKKSHLLLLTSFISILVIGFFHTINKIQPFYLR